jgi:hypothetical protein
MRKSKQIKYIHHGEYVAEVDVELIEAEDGWTPYLSIQDAYKLDDIREALCRNDLKTASKQARIFTMTPLAI